jgi:hypothetical protein
MFAVLGYAIFRRDWPFIVDRGIYELIYECGKEPHIRHPHGRHRVSRNLDLVVPIEAVPRSRRHHNDCDRQPRLVRLGDGDDELGNDPVTLPSFCMWL